VATWLILGSIRAAPFPWHLINITLGIVFSSAGDSYHLFLVIVIFGRRVVLLNRQHNNSFNRSANSAAFIRKVECLSRFVAPG
jgi:hypothetical protein